MKSSEKSATPKRASYSPALSPERRSQPNVTGATKITGIPRRAMTPVAPGWSSQRIGGSSGTAAIKPPETATMNVAVWKAITVSYGSE
jgi:hypothetical protein